MARSMVHLCCYRFAGKRCYFKANKCVIADDNGWGERYLCSVHEQLVRIENVLVEATKLSEAIEAESRKRLRG